MEDDELVDSSEKFEKALADSKKTKYVLRLFIAGNSTKSANAIDSIRDICETNLKGRYTLEVIDIYQQPELARGEQIIAAPTLIKSLPPPLRRIIGDLSSKERILIGLNLKELNGNSEKRKEDGDGKS